MQVIFFVFTHPEDLPAEMKIKQSFILIVVTVEVAPGCPTSAQLLLWNEGGIQAAERRLRHSWEMCVWFFSPVMISAAFPVTHLLAHIFSILFFAIITPS